LGPLESPSLWRLLTTRPATAFPTGRRRGPRGGHRGGHRGESNDDEKGGDGSLASLHGLLGGSPIGSSSEREKGYWDPSGGLQGPRNCVSGMVSGN
jgi:hypothetical protein